MECSSHSSDLSESCIHLINTGFLWSRQDVIPTLIMLALYLLCENNYFTLYVMGSICKISCDEFWGKHDPSRWDIIPLFGGYAHHDTSLWVLNIYKHFLLPSYIRGLLPWFSLISLPECSWILFEICLCGAVTVSNIVKFLSTIIACDAIKVYLRVLFIVFCFTFIISGFTKL